MQLNTPDKVSIESAEIVLKELRKYNGNHRAAFYGVIDVACKIIEEWKTLQQEKAPTIVV